MQKKEITINHEYAKNGRCIREEFYDFVLNYLKNNFL